MSDSEPIPPYERQALVYLRRLGEALAGRRLSKSDCAVLFEDMLHIASAASPPEPFRPWFYRAAVLRELAEGLFVRYSFALREAVQDVFESRPWSRDARFMRVRRLGPTGWYPNTEFHAAYGSYVIRAEVPYLVTINSPREERKWSFGSELNDWTRHETRLATALTCARRGGFRVYLSRDQINFPVEVVQHVPAGMRAAFGAEVMALRERMEDRATRATSPRAPGVAISAEFSDFRPHRELASAFASRFIVGNSLLLRTSKYLVKSDMLALCDGLEEDSFAALLFALEGCVLLFQEVHGVPTDGIKRRFLRQALEATFPHGAVDYDYIEEALDWGGTRANLVHPQLAAEHGWTPFLMAEDWFEYRHFVRSFLVYLVTDRMVGWFDEDDI